MARSSASRSYLPAKVTPPRGWSFCMVAASVETITTFLTGVRASTRPYTTLIVWMALMAYVERDTGRLTCSQRQLARTAGVTQGDVSRALERLVEMGVLQKHGRGRYSVHPSVMWRGELAKRDHAEAGAPGLTLIDGGLSD